MVYFFGVGLLIVHISSSGEERFRHWFSADAAEGPFIF